MRDPEFLVAKWRPKRNDESLFAWIWDAFLEHERLVADVAALETRIGQFYDDLLRRTSEADERRPSCASTRGAAVVPAGVQET